MKKIFIVDDNNHLLDYIEKFLLNKGYEVRIAHNGLSTIEALSEYQADFVFIDYFLPRINADRLCQIIRKMENQKNAYLVIMSAAASELSLNLKDIQADAIIAKGTFKETSESLLNAIENAGRQRTKNEEVGVIGIESIYPRRMTQELLAQNSHLRAMLDSISEGILEVYQGKIVYANPASEKLLGKSQVKMLTGYFLDLFNGISRSQAKTLMDTVYKSGLKGVPKETIKHNNRLLWLKAYPLEKDPDTIIILITDMTALIEAEEKLRNYQQHLETLVEERTRELEVANEKLRHAQKMEAIGIIAGGVAHDLNNILSGIVSYPDLLLMEIPDNSPMKKPIDTIKKSGEKAAAIVQDLLTLARRGVIRDEILCLNGIIMDYIESPEFDRMISYHSNVEIVYDLEKELLNFKCSSVHVSKSLMNLVSNAAEAMPDGGKIRISTENLYIERESKSKEAMPPGEYIILKIEDEGIGMSEDDIQHIFEPFYTKKKMGRSGTGLGMAVVWGTIKDHNGYIEIDSKKGEGTVFRIYFPATRELPIKEKNRITLQEYMGNNEKILIVDDEEDQREISSSILSKLGYRVKTVSSGEDAIECLTNNIFNLVILDMIMPPGIDGLDTYRKIKQLLPAQKAIIASGYAETGRIRKAKQLGVGQFIRKPYTMERIGLAVRTELDKQHSEIS